MLITIDEAVKSLLCGKCNFAGRKKKRGKTLQLSYMAFFKLSKYPRWDVRVKDRRQGAYC